jgi:thiamine pyrophosphate-dependent acetolactate synthase large subunit-like protein
MLEKPVVLKNSDARMHWGSDLIAELLRRLGIKYVCINPGSSFRGLHDSLVNYLGNERPKMILAVHEQSVVAIAHGYYKASNEPMAVVLHSNVGLMAGMMSIFNAWCDRVPILILGATGAVDSAVRRSWIDWNHTFRDQGAMVRHFVKWDEQPASVRAAIDGVLRTYQMACTPPCGPGYVILDRRLQEDPISGEIAIPDVRRYQPAAGNGPTPEVIEQVVELLAAAKRPVMLIGRVSRRQRDWDNRVRLAELLGARAITDLRVGASFPTEHPLHGGPADLFLSPANRRLLAQADVVLSLDWQDLADAMAQAHSRAKLIHVSIDSHAHNPFSADHQRLPAVDLAVAVAPDAVLMPLIEGLRDRVIEKSMSSVRAGSSRSESPPQDATPTLADIGCALSNLREGRRICLARVPLNWPAASYAFREPLDYLGYDGGGGVGSGPGMTVGAALALQETGRITVGIMGDGEFIGAPTALWTAAHYRIPMLIVVANNRSYFTDEIQQEMVARERKRPIENRWIGQRMDDPPIDIAGVARDLGVDADGPVARSADLPTALRRGLEVVENGKPYLVDVLIDSSHGGSFHWLADA